MVTPVAIAAVLLTVLSSAPKQRATGKAEFEQAMRYYDAQEYEAALAQFQRAAELSNRRPSVIRALAQCERALKMYDEAIAHFREYLSTKPDDARAIAETIRMIEKLRAERVATAAPKPPADAPEPLPAVEPEPAPVEVEPQLAPAPSPRLPPEREESDNLAPMIVTIGAGVLAATGGVLFALGRRDLSAVEDAPKETRFDEVSSAADRAPVLTGTGGVLLVAGGAGLIAGIIWLASGDEP